MKPDFTPLTWRIFAVLLRCATRLQLNAVPECGYQGAPAI